VLRRAYLAAPGRVAPSRLELAVPRLAIPSICDGHPLPYTPGGREAPLAEATPAGRAPHARESPAAGRRPSIEVPVPTPSVSAFR
jgi:hypothetical protein